MLGRLLLVLAAATALAAAAAAVRINEVTEKCRNECGTSLLTQTGEVSDFHCNDSCRINQCSLGCQHWQDAIRDDNCWDVCSKRNNFSSDNSIMHLCCVMGCRFAGSLYIQNVKEEVGVPSAPALVADSQTNTSVRLCWDGASRSRVPLSVSYRLQWKYESAGGNGGWEYYRPKVPIVDTTQLISGLQPYTKYRFRVAWIILPQHNPLISSESVVISTLAFGVPASPPIITSVTHIDASRVSVTWEPPAFPNGPVLSYVAHLSQLPNGVPVIKDIPGPQAENFFIFSNLKPNTTYSIAVSCRNTVGEGPKETRNVTTPAKMQLNDTSAAYLILAARRKVFKQSRDMRGNPQVLYQTNDASVTIEGIAIHVKKQLLFVSDSSGSIRHVPIGRAAELDELDELATDVTPADAADGHPRSLSVDWLNDKLYVAEGTRVTRCDLNGSNYEVVVTGLERAPADIKVDPYNGYLYWVQHGSPNGGLFQVDLMDLEHGRAIEDSKNTVHLLVADSNLAAFTVDHQNFRLFFPNETGNTIYATSLNGLEIFNIRQNTQKSQFRGIKSITYFRDLFYLMTKDELIGEEYHRDKYYHNSFQYFTADKPFVGLEMLHSDAQPIPVPINQPRELQAVCKETMAKLQWLAPLPLSLLGRGSWRRWLYEVSVEDHARNHTTSLRGVAATTHTLRGLAEDTEYSVKVRAYSAGGGKGPWSAVFKARTLKPAIARGYPHVLWSAGGGILKSDIIGDNIEPLVHRTNLLLEHVIDIAWYEDLLFLNTNASNVYVYNASNRSAPNMTEIVTSAVSVSVDWLGRKLYWSNPKQQMISRVNFDGSQVESLLILTIAKELNVDAFNGFIYWTTMHSVECARLNGDDPRTYYQTGNYFSGKQVMGLTLDHDHQRVYWLVWSFSGARLYHARMASHQDRVSGMDSLRANVEEFSPPSEYTIADRQGVLRYYSDHLYWLQNQSQALVSDIYQQNVARLHALDLDDLKTLIVIDPTLQPCPEGFTLSNISVIPWAVDEASLRVNGRWSDFNVTWSPVANVNYGQVYYEIVVDDHATNNTLVWKHPWYVYPSTSSLAPYSPLTISIRAFTYWGFSRRITKALRSPMSVPSEPLNPRVFVTYDRSPSTSSSYSSGSSVQAEFRWRPPLRPNGVVLGYVVTVWNAGPDGRRNPDPISDEGVGGDKKPVYFTQLLRPDVSYYFQVRAYTEAGEGPPSAMVEAVAGAELPVPRLLLAKSDGVCVADVDTREEERLPAEASHPVDVAYVFEAKRVFWLDQGATLMSANRNGTNKTKLRELSATGTSLTVDWLGRQLYWSEVDQASKTSAIWTMDLNRMKDDPEIVVESKNEIGSVRVDPFTSKLLWTSIFGDGLGCLMSSQTDGTVIRSVFPVVRRCFYSARAPGAKANADKRIGKRESDSSMDDSGAVDKDISLPTATSTTTTTTNNNNNNNNVSFDYEDQLLLMADQPPSSDCDCARDVVVGAAMTLDASNGTEAQLVWVDVRWLNVWTSDLRGCRCRLLVNGTMMPDNGLPPTSITVDGTHVYWSNATTGRIYSAPKPPPPSVNGSDVGTSGRSSKPPERMLVKSEEARGVRGITAFGAHLQPYPDIKCLAPQSYVEQAQPENVSSTAVTLLLKPVRQLPECGDISMASVSYVLMYAVLKNDAAGDADDEDACGKCDAAGNGICFGGAASSAYDNATMPSACQSLVTHNTTVNLSDLRPYSGYSVRVAASNVYGPTPMIPGPRILFRTAEGVPAKPRNVRVRVLTPEKVDVAWDAPPVIYGPAVRYYVQWKGHLPGMSDRQTYSDNFRQVIEEEEPRRDNTTAGGSGAAYDVALTGLQPGQNYSIVVRAQPMSGDAFNASDEVFVRTFDVPNNLTLTSLTSTAIALTWRSPSDGSILRHSLLHKEYFGNVTAESEPEATKPDRAYAFNVTDLTPNMRYVFRLKVVYDSDGAPPYVWPADKANGFHFETKGDRPSPPGSPEVVSIQRDTYKVTWKPADARGGKDVRYFLQVQSRDKDPSETGTAAATTTAAVAATDWRQVYNGSECKWVAAGLDPDGRYAFRVFAANEFGVGNFSEESAAVIFSQIPVFGDKEGEQLALVLGVTVPTVFLFLSVSLYVLCTVYKKREKDKKMLQEMALNLRGPDVELSTLRELPHHRSFVHQNNALYAVGDAISDEELASLPRVGIEQLVSVKFLGSGAFGEVYEGLARNLPGTDSEEAVPVAIKTLRKGATDTEKTEFLKEAKLMSNFKHEHILHLLGVCLNSDPNLIILELMEGGDLLSYLRSHRPTVVDFQFSSPSLNIQDLISICVDVAKGCRYLEELRFVHRDLAARNCLVSSFDSSQRVVKIGDFGLARDVYKSDYYRKEGEGLLPVRWMSPESLVDGVFTSHSDVWAFGVLLWEILTLGEQPYPARSNLEVLHFVRGGGRLDKPDNSPDDLHELMLRCWSYNPHERPTFKYCLEQLQELKRKSAELPLTAVHNRNYLGRNGDKRDDGPRRTHPRTATATAAAAARHNMAAVEADDQDDADDRHGDSRHGVARDISDSNDRTELLDPGSPAEEAHKYLELLYDSDAPPMYESDGYETPLSPDHRRQAPPAPVPADRSVRGGGGGAEPNRRWSDAAVLTESGNEVMSGGGGGVVQAKSGVMSGAAAVPAESWGEVKNGGGGAAGLKCGVSQPLLRDPFSRSRCSVASAGDADGDARARTLKLISDSAPLLQNVSNLYANAKRGRFGYPPWKDSSLSLGSGSDCSSPASPSPISGGGGNGDGISGMSTLSALSGLVSSSNSSSTSGIEADFGQAWRY